jgi:hypothetical protein
MELGESVPGLGGVCVGSGTQAQHRVCRISKLFALQQFLEEAQHV